MDWYAPLFVVILDVFKTDALGPLAARYFFRHLVNLPVTIAVSIDYFFTLGAKTKKPAHSAGFVLLICREG